MKIVSTFAVYYFTNTLRKMVTIIITGVATALGLMAVLKK